MMKQDCEKEEIMKQPVREVMRAVEYDQYGPPNVLQTRMVPRPRAGRGEALVQVYASSVNPIDTIIRSGQLRLRTGRKFPKRIGIDFVGEVVEIETEASDFKVGDRVWGVTLLTESGVGQGTAADFVTISTTHIALSPKNLNMLEAASISSVGAVASSPYETRPGCALANVSLFAERRVAWGAWRFSWEKCWARTSLRSPRPKILIL
jgi:NADPH:quinone reductase-like Zn-dependent oxidoreductase